MNLEIGEMGRLSLNSTQDVKISSICTVFAESEVISLLAKKLYDPCDIMMGIHSSVVRRVNMLVQKARLEPPIVMTGGVAKNVGVIAAFERLLGTKLLIPADPQMIGAMGAAVLALETYQKAHSAQEQKGPYNRRRYY
jgi:activator of 2-hydroxyglutaryl-CoA dehydratase